MLHWTDFPDAPVVHSPVCNLSEVQTGVTALSLGEFPILLVKDDKGIRAFVNACPHQFLPLDTRGNVLGAGGARLICTNHDAAFDAVTGQGVSGFGLNCALTILPIEQSGEVLIISAD